MTTFDLTPLLRSTIGFDRMTHMLESGMTPENSGGYPPYNIIKMDDDIYEISMAVAGFTDDELEITAKENVLLVEGRPLQKQHDEDHSFLHRGIAQRGFERHFQLADYIRVAGAKLENGLLSIDLVRELPERMKPRTIEIKSGKDSGKNLIEQDKKKSKRVA